MMNWHDKLNALDPFFAAPEQLQELVETAPTAEDREWLSDLIEQNKAFSERLGVTKSYTTGKAGGLRL